MDRPSWTVRVGNADRGAAIGYVRSSRIEVGLPLQFDEQYGRVTALEYLGAAVAADLVVGLTELARRLRLQLDHVEAVAHIELENALVHLGVKGEVGSPRIERIAIKIYVDTLDDPAAVERAFREVLDRSPLVQTLGPTVEFSHELKIT